MSSNLKADYFSLEISFNPGKLSDLAAISFAANLLHSKIEHMREYPGNELVDYSSSYLDQADVFIPKSLRATIDKFMVDTDSSWVQWWSHQQNVFLEQVPADKMIPWIDQLVWLPDGTINYEKTARKLMDGDKTTNVQKFQLACAYCFMEDVERLMQTLKKDEIEKATSGRGSCIDNDFFSTYWCGCRFREGWLNFNNYDMFHWVIDWLNGREISTLKCYDEWPLIEHLFNRVNHHDKLYRMKKVIDLESPRLTLNVLTKLAGDDLNSIMRDRSCTIIKALVKKPLYFEHTLMIWELVVPSIHHRDLAEIVRYVNDLKLERSYVNALLWEIWLATSDLQKNLIVDGMIYYFTEKSFDNDYDLHFPPNYPLILDILSRSNPELRYQY